MIPRDVPLSNKEKASLNSADLLAHVSEQHERAFEGV